MFERYTGHGLDRVECCDAAQPCAYHGRFPEAVRSPHIAADFTMQLCPECSESVRGRVDVATA